MGGSLDAQLGEPFAGIVHHAVFILIVAEDVAVVCGNPDLCRLVLRHLDDVAFLLTVVLGKRIDAVAETVESGKSVEGAEPEITLLVFEDGAHVIIAQSRLDVDGAEAVLRLHDSGLQQ